MRCRKCDARTPERLAEIQRLYDLSMHDGVWSDEHWQALWDCRRAVPELIEEVRRLQAIERLAANLAVALEMMLCLDGASLTEEARAEYTKLVEISRG